jgi:hypothetical protein
MIETLDKRGTMKRNRKPLYAALVVALALFCLVSPVFVTALRNAVPLDIATATSPSWLCRHGAYLGRPEVRELWPLETTFFGDSINGKDTWFFDESTVHVADPGTVQATYDQENSIPLGRMSSHTKTLLLLARQEYGL